MPPHGGRLEINVKNMLRILPFFEVRSINIRRHLSKRQPACIFFPFRFVPPYGGGMEINMKKVILSTLSATMIFGGLGTANAEDGITLKVNGNVIAADTAPIIVNDRTLVPIRAAAEALNCDIAWDGENRAVTVCDGEKLYFMWIDRPNVFKINTAALEEGYRLDAAPMIYNDRTMIPIRAVAELFGAKVNWLGDERTVTIDYDVREKPPEGIAGEFSAYTKAMSEMYDEYSDYVFDKKNVVKAEIELENGGVISLDLFKDIAPQSVANFVSLAKNGAFDGKIFHRVIKDFMIQGGAYDTDNKYTEAESIPGEFLANSFFNLISHKRGVISMARTNDPDSGSNQFFIVHKDSEFLDGNYAAFGIVTSGMEYVDGIAGVQTDSGDKPVENCVIKTVKINL